MTSEKSEIIFITQGTVNICGIKRKQTKSTQHPVLQNSHQEQLTLDSFLEPPNFKIWK